LKTSQNVRDSIKLTSFSTLITNLLWFGGLKLK
jgi:hypothetical protein